MRTNASRVIVGIVVFAVALGGGLMLLHSSSSNSSKGKRDDGGHTATAPATSEIWKVGDSWIMKVRQDSGAITPSGDRSVATVPFHFEVVSAPSNATGAWHVHATQEGAEGPFAKGWNLWYVEKDDAMVLKRVSVGDEKPLEAELAAIVLGPQFPYEVRYDAPPKNGTVDAADLLKQSQLPPSSVPTGTAPSAMPPAAPN